jgi:hypothetical protein
VDEVAQAAAAGLDGVLQGLFDGGHQTFNTLAGDFSGGAAGVDAGAEEALRSVDVADADDAVAVHEGDFDGGFESARLVVQPLRGEGVVEGFDAEWGNQCVLFGIAFDPEQGTEAAWVAQAQYAFARPVSERNVDMVVLLYGDIMAHDAQAAGHAEVQQDDAGIKLKQ